VLLKGVDVLAAGSLGDKTVVVNGVDVLFAGNCITKTSAGTVFVADAPGLVAQRLFDIRPCVNIVVKPAQQMPMLNPTGTRDVQAALVDCSDVQRQHTLRAPGLCALDRHPE